MTTIQVQTQLSFETLLNSLQQLEAAELDQIEMLLQSLKKDIPQQEPVTKPKKPFKVRTFNLGLDIQVDRDQLYLQRGL